MILKKKITTQIAKVDAGIFHQNPTREFQPVGWDPMGLGGVFLGGKFLDHQKCTDFPIEPRKRKTRPYFRLPLDIQIPPQF